MDSYRAEKRAAIKIELADENARIEPDAALNRLVTGLVADHTELFKQFTDNPEFGKWLRDWCFKPRISSPACRRGSSVSAPTPYRVLFCAAPGTPMDKLSEPPLSSRPFRRTEIALVARGINITKAAELCNKGGCANSHSGAGPLGRKPPC